MHPLAYTLGFSGALPFIFYGAQHAPSHAPGAPAGAPPWGDALLTRAGLSIFSAGDQATVRRRFATYSVSILSFLGAVHMGAALAHAPATLKTRAMLIYSVCPSLTGWVAVNLPHAAENAGQAYVLLGGGFLAALAADRAAGLPPWYIKMRVPQRLTPAA